MSANNITLNKSLIFPNRIYVFDASGRQIDPKSSQGIVIQAAWDYQTSVRKQNTDQHIKFAWDTYPRDDVKRQALLKSFGLAPNSPPPGQ